MEFKENEVTAKVLAWVRDCPVTWDILQNESGMDIHMKDAVDILEDMLDQELYQMAIVLLGKLDRDQYVHQAITDTLVRRVKEVSHEKGWLTDIVETLKAEIREQGLEEKVLVI